MPDTSETLEFRIVEMEAHITETKAEIAETKAQRIAAERALEFFQRVLFVLRVQLAMKLSELR